MCISTVYYLLVASGDAFCLCSTFTTTISSIFPLNPFFHCSCCTSSLTGKSMTQPVHNNNAWYTLYIYSFDLMQGKGDSQRPELLLVTGTGWRMQCNDSDGQIFLPCPLTGIALGVVFLLWDLCVVQLFWLLDQKLELGAAEIETAVHCS